MPTLSHATTWHLCCVADAGDDLLLSGDDNLHSIEFSDVHLLVGVAVADVIEHAGFEYYEGTVARSLPPVTTLCTFDDIVTALRRTTSFVITLPRRDGVDFVSKTLNGMVFNRVNYRASSQGVVAEMRFVKTYAVVAEPTSKKESDGKSAA